MGPANGMPHAASGLRMGGGAAVQSQGGAIFYVSHSDRLPCAFLQHAWLVTVH